MDCCCGSGVIFLAAASTLPQWMVQLGLVQFYGADIDETCVKMARLNCMLYGMNGYGLKCTLDITDKQITAQALAPLASLYIEAKTAELARLEEIKPQVRSGVWQQAALFDSVEA